MNLNPFNVELNNLLKKKNNLVEKLENTKSDLGFFETLNYNTLLFDINALEEKILNVKNELKKIDQEKIGYNFQLISIMNNKIISKAYNKKNLKNISIYHAEMLAIIKACKKLKSWRLNDCDLYVTMEPCIMCSGAIVHSRIKKLIIEISEANLPINFLPSKQI